MPRRGSVRRGERTLCDALLSDEATACTAVAMHRSSRCPEHEREFKAVLREYKSNGEIVKSLQSLAILTAKEIHALNSFCEVSEAIGRIEQYIQALTHEIEGRRTHQIRFFRVEDHDEGHNLRIQKQENKRRHAHTIREKLILRQTSISDSKRIASEVQYGKQVEIVREKQKEEIRKQREREWREWQRQPAMNQTRYEAEYRKEQLKRQQCSYQREEALAREGAIRRQWTPSYGDDPKPEPNSEPEGETLSSRLLRYAMTGIKLYAAYKAISWVRRL